MRNKNATSPFPATTLELCERFGTTPERCAVLRGFLKMRSLMHQVQMVEGFQWVAGPFLEDDGRRKGRSPDCIQVVTFYHPSPVYHDPDYSHLFEPFKCARATRAQFAVDHGIVNLDWTSLEIIDWTRHWTALFSHQADTGIRKGLLKISLHTLEEDAAALRYLEIKEAA